MLGSKHNDIADKRNLPASCFWKVYRQGVITNVLNPKVALFFLSFLPQFIDPDHGSVGSFMLLGVIYVLTCTIWYLIFFVLTDLHRFHCTHRPMEFVLHGSPLIQMAPER